MKLSVLSKTVLLLPVTARAAGAFVDPSVFQVEAAVIPQGQSIQDTDFTVCDWDVDILGADPVYSIRFIIGPASDSNVLLTSGIKYIMYGRITVGASDEVPVVFSQNLIEAV